MSIERWSAEIAKASNELAEAEAVILKAQEVEQSIQRRIHRLKAERAQYIASHDALARKLAGVHLNPLAAQSGMVASVQRIAEPPPAYCQEHGWWDGQLSPVLQGCPRCSLNAGSMATPQQDALAKAVQQARQNPTDPSHRMDAAVQQAGHTERGPGR